MLSRIKGFAIIELVFRISLISTLVVAIIIQINPYEIVRERRDARLRADAIKLLKSINNFSEQQGRLPWADDFGTDQSTPALVWTDGKNPIIGACKNISCSYGGELVEKNMLDFDFIKNSSIISPKRDSLLVGKGKFPDNKVFVCFQPDSEKQRKNFAELYSLNLEDGITSKGAPLKCTDEVTWKDNDICHICL